MREPLDRLRRRPVLSAALVYGLLSLLMFAPGLVPGRALSASDYLWTATPWDASRPAAVPLLGSNREQTDAVFVFQPQLRYTRDRLPHVPLWNPYIMGGRPYQANSQSAVFSPFSLPSYVLPFWTSLAVVAALKLFVSALGTFLLGRLLGMRFAGALMAGLVFGFSLWCVSWVAWTTLSVWAFLPWMLLLGELVVRRPGALTSAALAAVVGLQFLGGHPPSSFQILVPVALYCGARVLLRRPFERRAAGVRLAWLGSAFAVGTALAGVMLIPFVEFLRRSIDLEERVAGHLPARRLLEVFMPDYAGRTTRGTALEFAAALEEHAYYIGALALLLAVAALVLRRRRERVVAAVAALAALAVATGIPPLYQLVKLVPGFTDANNWRLAVFSVLCGALLAGWGLDDLLRSDVPARRRRALVAACAALAALPVVVVVAGGSVEPTGLWTALKMASGLWHPPASLAISDRPALTNLVHLSALMGWIVVAAGALLLLVLRLRGRIGATAFAALALAFVAADLFRAGMGYNPAVPRSHAEQPTTGALRFLQAQRPARFAGLDPVDPFSLAVPLPPNVSLSYRLYDARGYDLPVEKRYVQLWRAGVPVPEQCNYAFCPGSVSSRPAALRVLGLFGVRHLLQNRRDALLRGLPVAYDGPDARVYENPHALPRAFVVDRQAVVSSDRAAIATLSSAGFAARSVAVTDRPVPGLRARAPAGGAPAGRARIVNYEPERVVVRARAVRRSLVVLTDSWFPGWQATVDGERAPIRRVDHVLRGVVVGPGEHTVEFRYAPASWRAGWIVSLAALLAVALAVGIGVRRR
jgi:hypothetical protein